MLKFYLNKLKTVEDVRTMNRETFKLSKYLNYESNEIDELVSNLYLNKES